MSNVTYTVNGTELEFENESAASHTIRTEKPVLDDLVNELEESDVFWDVGACGGTYAIAAGEASDNVVSIAIEPHPENISYINQNRHLNESTILILNNALFKQNAVVQMREKDKANHAIKGGGSLEVVAKKADDITSPKLYPDVIKIDVEGAEWDVVKGASEVLNLCRVLYIEIHDRDDATTVKDYGHTADSVIELLEGYFDDVNVLIDRGDNYIYKCE